MLLLMKVCITLRITLRRSMYHFAYHVAAHFIAVYFILLVYHCVGPYVNPTRWGCK